MRRHQIRKAQVYLDPEVMKTLSSYAARCEQPMSLVAEAAIASFLSPDADGRREAAIAKRLDQVDRRIAPLEREMGFRSRPWHCSFGSGSGQHRHTPGPAAKAARAQGARGWTIS
nr:hypothetical protein BDOA9_0204450 [Bradyrhizobium sp. DOA9]